MLGSGSSKLPRSIQLFVIALVGGLMLAGAALPSRAEAVSSKTVVATQVAGIMYPGTKSHPQPIAAYLWKIGGTYGYCIDSGRHDPDSVASSREVKVLPGMSAEQSAQAIDISGSFNDKQTSNADAARAAWGVWLVSGDSAATKSYAELRKSGKISGAMDHDIMAIIERSKHHAPFQVRVMADRAEVGREASGFVEVLGADGKPALGREVFLTAKGAALKNVKKTTDDKGQAKFTLKPTDLSLKIDAKLIAPTSTALLSTPSKGRQRLVSGVKQSKYASYGLDVIAGKLAAAVECSTDCDGNPNVTFQAPCNKAKGYTELWFINVNGKSPVKLKASQGECKAVQTVRLLDGDHYKVSHCYALKGKDKCATRMGDLSNEAGNEIVCPPWPEGSLTLPISCKPGQSGYATLVGRVSKRFYIGYVRVNATRHEAILGSGTTTQISTGPLPPNAVIEVGFEAYDGPARATQLIAHVLKTSSNGECQDAAKQ